MTVQWGDYYPLKDHTVGQSANDVGEAEILSPSEIETIPTSEAPNHSVSGNWKRIPRQAQITIPLKLPLHQSQSPKTIPIPDHHGLQIVVSIRPVTSKELVPGGTRSVSVFLVNNRLPTSDKECDVTYTFQTSLIINTPEPLVPRPNLRGRDPQIFASFCIANLAIATSLRQRATHGKNTPPERETAPKWRPFQLAFLLMNLPGIAYPENSDRQLVDLLFFPTGGGKTEAYLGLAAFTLVLRRLRYPGVKSAGLSVLMRYTLRLLTLDQLGRAATMICALELERQKNPQQLGTWPFEIGLWVGQSATPNRMGKKGDNDENTARKRTLDFQKNNGSPSPIPLESCPWCGTKFTRNSFQLKPKPEQPKNLQISCANRRCNFQGDHPLPIVAVDESIYRRLPCFIISTVDKFASLPWVGETGALFGRVDRHDNDGFYGPTQIGCGKPLGGYLPPPDLIIQDELHLISEPLGTMEKPGLVVTLLNIHRPRDRSHYERFGAWHSTFYRAVEATSVTPFSPRAIDRGLAAITVALARLGHSKMTAPRHAFDITQHRQDLSRPALVNLATALVAIALLLPNS